MINRKHSGTRTSALPPMVALASIFDHHQDIINSKLTKFKLATNTFSATVERLSKKTSSHSDHHQNLMDWSGQSIHRIPLRSIYNLLHNPVNRHSQTNSRVTYLMIQKLTSYTKRGPDIPTAITVGEESSNK